MIADERGRVPFAIVGVLLLVASATIAATSGPAAPTADPAVESALDRATATVNGEVRGAIRTATEGAAAAPVIAPANTSMGKALNESRPFHDSLRVRIYVRARERLADVDRRRGDVRVTASLPETPNSTDLKDAIQRVSLRETDANGTAISVRVRNVTLTVLRHGEVLTRQTVSPNVTVATPVLELHDRVSTYEERLNAPVTQPGLSRRMNAQLMAVAWARGWAQNQGAPIENVVATRHVSLAANAGVLDVQRTTIGHVDSEGLRTLHRDALATGGQDLLAGLNTPPGSGQITGSAADRLRAPPSDPVEVFDPPETPRRDDNTTVGVNRSADDAFLEYEELGLEDTIDAVYSVDAKPFVRVSDRSGGRPGRPDRPSPDAELVSQQVDTDTTVSAAGVGNAPDPGIGWVRVDEFAREVVMEYERTAVWSDDGETVETTSQSTESGTVAVTIAMRHGTDAIDQFGDVDHLYQVGAGPLNGSNLAGIDEKALEEVLDHRGGRDGIARKAVLGGLDTSLVVVTGDPPPGIVEYIMRDLNDLREAVRPVNVTVERGSVGSFSTNPHGLLADRLRDRHEELVDPPETFDGVADRARVAARSAYLDTVVEHVEDHASERTSQASAAGDRMEEEGSGNLSRLQSGVSARSPDRGRLYPTLHGPGGPVRLRVDSAPSYLPAQNELSAEEYPALEEDGYALTARNVNLFGIPYGELSDGILGWVIPDGTPRSRLDTAARALRAANSTLNRTTLSDTGDGETVIGDTPTNQSAMANLTTNRTELAQEVNEHLRYVEAEAVLLLREEDIGESTVDRFAIVEDGLDRWPTVAGKALAVSNGSAARPIARVARNRSDLDPYEYDHLRLRLGYRIRNAVADKRARPERPVLNDTVNATRDVASDMLATAAQDVVNQYGQRAVTAATNESVSQLPAGMPIVPAPGYWYATINAWTVTVRGEYARFGIRATSADPSSPGGEVAYVRDGSNVTLDVDGDGEDELLGRSTQVDFEAHAYLAVVVPPNPRGVGDTNGIRNETSAGWPRPGPN